MPRPLPSTSTSRKRVIPALARTTSTTRQRVAYAPTTRVRVVLVFGVRNPWGPGQDA